jgi:hypothetical protein
MSEQDNMAQRCAELRYKGLDKLMVQKIATLKADAVFLEGVHQFVKH